MSHILEAPDEGAEHDPGSSSVGMHNEHAQRQLHALARRDQEQHLRIS
jgi:hypothetical protein